MSGPGWVQMQAQAPPAVIATSAEGSTYVPMDSWIYGALDRLHGMGYLDTAYMGIRPWTRLSIAHMLQESSDRIDNETDNDEAKSIYLAVLNEVQPDIDNATEMGHPAAQLESVYTEFRGINGTPLRDSYHLGTSIDEDYGRPYEAGFNNYTGFSARAEAGRFTLYYRGEYQYAPSATGYGQGLVDYLSQTIDDVPIPSDPVQATIPGGAIGTVTSARLMEGSIAYHLWDHEISFGKNDHWLGPGQGGAMLWSTNAEDIYTFQIDRVEPLWVPGLSRLTGKFRYDFYVGSLKGHTFPNDPWVHVEKISFKPSANMEIGFSREVIWGGAGHEPVTIHTFLRSFFSVAAPPHSVKDSRRDPGARFSAADFEYRLPGLRHWLTIYTDSTIHDNVSPVVAPWSDGLRPGIYLSHFPGAERLDMRVEAATTDPGEVGNRDKLGRWLYWETVQRQGPTNKGYLLGDPIGRQDKGGQAWLTYHLSPQEEIQFSYRNTKASNKFITGGTTQNDFEGSVRKRLGKDIEVRGQVQYEGWRAPIYKTGPQSDTSVSAQITWFPHQQSQ
ncbi:MAG TPA: capsule assembly Wzi family protein [Acidobacteriaceae bacterium]|nr:capsule assembly Wzi family protein [Acidobacteriaceae bacterium]